MTWSVDSERVAGLFAAARRQEALPAGGLMKMDMETDVSQVMVRVSDTGPGIPEALLDRIYDRDFTTKGTGSGIGLYVARVLPIVARD